MAVSSVVVKLYFLRCLKPNHRARTLLTGQPTNSGKLVKASCSLIICFWSSSNRSPVEASSPRSGYWIVPRRASAYRPNMGYEHHCIYVLVTHRAFLRTVCVHVFGWNPTGRHARQKSCRFVLTARVSNVASTRLGRLKFSTLASGDRSITSAYSGTDPNIENKGVGQYIQRRFDVQPEYYVAH